MRTPSIRAVVAAGVVTVLSASGTAVLAPAAAAATVQPNTPYVLVNRNSGKALDVWSGPPPTAPACRSTRTLTAPTSSGS